MIQTQILIINKYGLHARAAAKFVSTASAFSSEITMGRDGELINGKSIMSVMMLAAAKGAELELQIEGDDEQAALDAIVRLVENFFDEDE